MSKKPGKKGKPAQTRQQQQEAAARRRTATGPPAASRAAPPQPTAPDRARLSRRQPRGSRPVRHYLDVSVVRIQEWLGPDAGPEVPARRVGHAEPGDRAGGVAGRRAPGGHAVERPRPGTLTALSRWSSTARCPSPRSPARWQAAARQVATALRAKLPFCHIQAVAGSGDSYATAFGEH